MVTRNLFYITLFIFAVNGSVHAQRNIRSLTPDKDSVQVVNGNTYAIITGISMYKTVPPLEREAGCPLQILTSLPTKMQQG
jgi:hypothetical protein